MPKTALRLVVTAISLLAVTVLIDILPESIFANNGLTEQSSLNPARVALDWIRRLPTEPLFYLLIVVVAGTYFVVRWYLHARRNDRLIGQESQNLLSRLSSDDWHAIQDLRRRAFASRTHADVTLGGVFALLFGSIYLVLFILPQVPETDRVVEQEVRLQERYGETLKNIGRGEYWLELDESTARTLDRRNVTEPAIQTRRGRTLAELPRTYRNIVFGLTQINFSRSRENKARFLRYTRDEFNFPQMAARHGMILHNSRFGRTNSSFRSHSVRMEPMVFCPVTKAQYSRRMTAGRPGAK